MLTLRINPRQWVGERRRKNGPISPGDYLVTVDHGIQSNGVWKPSHAKTIPSIFLSVTATLIAWVVSARLAVIANKRRVYHDEVNQRLHNVTRVSALPLKSGSRKTKAIRMAECGRVDARLRKARRTNGR